MCVSINLIFTLCIGRTRQFCCPILLLILPFQDTKHSKWIDCDLVSLQISFFLVFLVFWRLAGPQARRLGFADAEARAGQDGDEVRSQGRRAYPGGGRKHGLQGLRRVRCRSERSPGGHRAVEALAVEQLPQVEVRGYGESRGNHEQDRRRSVQPRQRLPEPHQR